MKASKEDLLQDNLGSFECGGVTYLLMTSWSKGNQMRKKLTEIAEIIDLLKHHMKNFQARNVGFS